MFQDVGRGRLRANNGSASYDGAYDHPRGGAGHRGMSMDMMQQQAPPPPPSRGMHGRSRTHGGYSDEDRGGYDPEYPDDPHRFASGGPGPPGHHPHHQPLGQHHQGPGGDRRYDHPRQRGGGHRMNSEGGGMGGGRGGRGRRGMDPHEMGDSDIESVVSATSAFSSQSAPHARAKRLG